MKILTLMKFLVKFWFQYGNCEIDIITETGNLQVEMPLGELAYSPREKRVKLLSEGFT